MDPKRPVCLIHEDTLTLSRDDRLFFDRTVVIAKDAKFPHVMNKIRVFDTSPYEKSMFVDADCLLVKTDIDTYWAAAATRHFSITGGKRQSGEWKGIEVKDVLQAQGIDYLIQMNAGVFYFDKSREAQGFFYGLENYFLRAHPGSFDSR
ncbi:hypothetical protein GCM10011504_59330 [Siccirubricoccus deserti]|uniref:Nucleotide-diphospho-sugar transferase domain-containing protein n=1 Tax=Siccirubricoccus deserti TaxID=2013562 RepID=A0A9X0R486_9PROT|nr:hypothetical protein [Siccirubricoccus deserti]MBC4019445.1 hypothetical protein [Siccirubricoccus deserti]GGC74422.1 hypothetical protein GCM10011504_59330 [Siccirubricoccus deserti]